MSTESGTSNKRFFQSTQALPQVTYVSEEESRLYGQEWLNFAERYRVSSDKFGSQPVTFDRKADSERFLSQLEVHGQLGSHWLDIYRRLYSKEKSNYATGRERILDSLLLVGTEIASLELIRGIRKAACQSKTQEEYFNLCDFVHCRGILTTLNGYSIIDLYNANIKDPQAVINAYDFFVGVSSKGAEARYYEDPQFGFPFSDTLTREFPLMSRGGTSQLIEGISSLLAPPPDHNELFPQSKGLQRMVTAAANSLLQKTKVIRESILEALANPKNPQHHVLTDRVNTLLHQHPETQLIALYCLGLSDTEKVRTLYRKAIVLADSSYNSEFYYLLASKINYFISELPEGTFLPTKDLIPYLTSDDSEPVETKKAELKDMATIVKGIFAKWSETNYALRPEAISWGKLLTPTYAQILFEKQNPLRLILLLHYQAELEDDLFLRFRFDLKKGLMDWSFLESPEDPELEVIRSDAISVTHQILTRLLEYLSQIYESKQILETNNVTTRQTPAGRSDTQAYLPDTWRKEVKRLGDEAESANSISIASLNESRSRTEEAIKTQIVLPEDDVLKKFLNNLTSYDRDNVTTGISQFNEMRIGRLRRKVKRDLEGNPLYTLRINTKTPGDARVLVRELNSTKGERYFEIIDIDYRKNIYRNNKI